MTEVLEYGLVVMLTLFIFVLIVLGYKDARQRDLELLKKYGSFDKVPPEERRDHYLG